MLQQYQAAIDKTLQDCVRISLHEYDMGQPYSFSSKIGGTPYMPIDFDYPMNSKGNYLYLLAQINFGEMPELVGFPQDGILQFYISDDYLYGCDIAGDQIKQDGFRVIYFDKIEEQNVTTDLSFLPDPKVLLPYSKSFLLTFNKEKMPITVEDYRFEDLFGGDDFLEAYAESMVVMGHIIGGYATFAQEDPRYNKNRDKEVLLLQIDTDDEHDIQWGDQGIANFFISKDDLARKDFSNVLYNWDCY